MKAVKFLWAWSMMVEAYICQFLGNIIEFQPVKIILIGRSFRLAVNWANVLTDGEMFPISESVQAPAPGDPSLNFQQNSRTH